MAETDTDVDTGAQLPSTPDLCLIIPLYGKFHFEEKGGHPLWGVEFFEGTMDCYCEGCGRHSVFMCKKKDYYERYGQYHNHMFSLWFTCTRNGMHKLCFVFRAHQGVLEKIGQYPSLGDLATPDLRKYRPVLGNERYREFVRGVGLASNDVGIGAFVYLRRVFEHLIESAHSQARGEASWEEDLFQRSRMDEKIELLKEYLPEFLVENRALYGILSVGIHTLSEEECLKAFPIVKISIELILDDELERAERKKKIEAARKEIAVVATAAKQPQT